MSEVTREHRDAAAKLLRLDWLDSNDVWLTHGVYGVRETALHQAEGVALALAAAEQRGRDGERARIMTALEAEMRRYSSLEEVEMYPDAYRDERCALAAFRELVEGDK